MRGRFEESQPLPVSRTRQPSKGWLGFWKLPDWLRPPEPFSNACASWTYWDACVRKTQPINNWRCPNFHARFPQQNNELFYCFITFPLHKPKVTDKDKNKYKRLPGSDGGLCQHRIYLFLKIKYLAKKPTVFLFLWKWSVNKACLWLFRSPFVTSFSCYQISGVIHYLSCWTLWCSHCSLSLGPLPL